MWDLNNVLDYADINRTVGPEHISSKTHETFARTGYVQALNKFYQIKKLK